eukprot:CAMPEP_0176395322 /NCGR_PEP_ID=MMETSP0126-20121128/43314_1 /TAXON_ID=141414 ORGANISM="Strombidinopsis acuminatum, Strain SPMC142" /NCGR_SAMPLE_ID=MMETSP0126 /ASSEMBLY_ACC=CAM_ASM_000229 /LENGTH=40 /DNA_ID= /DNA_START= /DNA_END= /DNA_ORIENTATION=
MIEDNQQTDNVNNLILGQEWSDDPSFKQVIEDFLPSSFLT